MNRDIIELREVIAKLVPILTGRGLVVTQRGSRAYVRANAKTRKPEAVNIPNISENASAAFIRAIQGFIDHEVAHVLITDFTIYGEAPGMKTSAQKQQFVQCHNMLEDVMIEREIVKIFPGSEKNIHDLRTMFIEDITKPALAKASSDKERFIYLLVPVLRALGGHVEFQDFLDAEGHWSNPFVKGLVDAWPAASIAKLKTCSTTVETFELTKELNAILYPPPPPKPPEPAKQEEKKEEQAPEKRPEKEDSKSEDKPEQEAGEGDGDGERDHSESEDDSDADEGEDGKAEKPEPEDDGDDEGAASEEEDDEAGQDVEPEGDDEEESGASDPEEDADDEGAADLDEDDAEDEEAPGAEADDDADDDGEVPDGDDDAEEEDDGADPDGEDDEDQPAGTGSSGDDEDEDQEDEDVDLNLGGDEDGEGDDAGTDFDHGMEDDDFDEGDDEGEGAPGSGGIGSDDDVEDSGADDVTGHDEDDGEGAGGGVGNGAPTKSMFDFDEDAFDDADLSNAMQHLISEQAVDEMSGEYVVFTRELDRIEPLVPPEQMNSKWVPNLEEEVRSMTGRMQKDIERLMASQSHIIRTPGHRTGKLHAPSLFRVSQGDPRVFSQKQEHTSKDTAVTLLCDNSGSMEGSKLRTAMVAAFALSTTLERVNISHEVMGFTTGDYYSVPPAIQQAMQEDMRASGIQYDRVHPIVMPIYKDFAEKVTPLVKARIAYVANAQKGLQGNIDGESLQYAAMRLMKRREKRKVMIVLSDGMPVGGARSPSHLKYVVKQLSDAGIDMIGIGIMSDAVKKFYPQHVVLQDIGQLPGEVMTELKNILK